ncbi:unnamed protein product [Camellia sinensis]
MSPMLEKDFASRRPMHNKLVYRPQKFLRSHPKLALQVFWRSQLPKLGSMVMPNVTLLELTSSMEKSLMLLKHLPTTVSLLTEKGNTKDDLRLPNDGNLLAQ